MSESCSETPPPPVNSIGSPWAGVAPLSPLCITDSNHEIVRPKPRRPSTTIRSDLQNASADATKPSVFPKPFLGNHTPNQRNISGRVHTPANLTPVLSAQEITNIDINPTPGNNLHNHERNHESNGAVKEDGMQPTNMRGPSGPRPHHHLSVQELRLQRVRECNSSSDDNRSSGHASMSDTGQSSPRDITQRNRPLRNAAQNQRARYRATPAKLNAGAPWAATTNNSTCGLDDIRRAIHQLSLRSHTSTSSTHSSVGSDNSMTTAERHMRTAGNGADASALGGSSNSNSTFNRLVRHSSLETINTNVTSADEFVWVDSHNRLVELQHLPWQQTCVQRVLKSGRCRDYLQRVSPEVVPRLSYLLQRALIRIAREVQRLASSTGLCSKHEIASAFRVVLCPPLSDSCIKSSLRAATMFALSGDCVLRQSKSTRAGLQLSVGRFHRWMADVRLGRFIHEYAAIYLSAGIENLLEEILIQCMPNDAEVNLTATILEHGIANNGDLWGLLQPYAHLNAGRIATGVLAMPRWASMSSLGSGSGRDSGRGSELSEPSLLTTCVGSLNELQELVARLRPRIALSRPAVQTLFYFMRCSQLEHAEQGTTPGTVQELCYERAYVVLPPLVEWLRVATAFGEHRQSSVIDRDDIMQTARLLLPGVDCPPRSIFYPDENASSVELAFKLILSGNIPQAQSLLPPSSGLDTLNSHGLTVLMLAAIQDDTQTCIMLLDAGAKVDVETPGPSENQHWTALTYAAILGHCRTARLLLERGSNVEGGAKLSEDRCTLTPLQVASGSGCIEMVALLLSHGANAFLSTLQRDSMSYSGAAQRGCYSPISVAAAHGKRAVLRRLVAQPPVPQRTDVLSLEEMLAEGTSVAPGQSNGMNRSANTGSASHSSTSAVIDRLTGVAIEQAPTSRSRIRALQEAMCHGTEADHLDIALELRALGVSWTLHCWMHALNVALQQRLDCIIDQLLQDFLQVCPDDYSNQFVQECLTLLFNIFRYSKKEGTILLLADIFCTCYGWEPIKSITIDQNTCAVSGTSRIDPKYVNNPELSDVTFRVEGKLFYGHKIVLVTASSRLRAMLSSKLCDGNPPVVQINDIRYNIFQFVMQYLYQGGCQALEPANGDILELMAAANFFQLDGLLRYCEARCAAMLDLDNVVSMYIHAKVYNAHQLLEYCQGFLLQNMVALLTYDDSVKRLLFSKKIPNHDVLAGLLSTLQARIKTRASSKPMITSVR